MGRMFSSHKAASVGFFFVLLGCAVTQVPASTQKIIHNFGSPGDGYSPSGGIIFDQSGNAYGTTGLGGVGRGAVYQLVPNADGTWTENVICLFGNQAPNGPEGPLVFDTFGNLYGIAGTDNGLGAVFRLTPSGDGSWNEATLHTFTGGSDGDSPSGLGIYSNQSYATAFTGGFYDGGATLAFGQISVFRWYDLVLHAFGNGQDGLGPIGPLTFDGFGAMYGVTQSGGASRLGIVYRLTPNLGRPGWTETILYEFKGSGDHNDGANPIGGVVLDSKGNLYGTTELGGRSNWGTVFELTPQPDGTWTEKVIHQFTPPDGRNPGGALTFDWAGNLYGVTPFGGSYNWGTVFKLIKHPNGAWTEDVLFSFTNGLDGGEPTGGVVLDNRGNLYGTAENGGTYQCTGLYYGCGVIYELTP